MMSSLLDKHGIVFNHMSPSFRESIGVDDERGVEILYAGLKNVENHIAALEEENPDNASLTYGKFLDLFCYSATSIQEAIQLLIESHSIWTMHKEDSVQALIGLTAVISQRSGASLETYGSEGFLTLNIAEDKHLNQIFNVSDERYLELIGKILKSRETCLDTFIEISKEEKELDPEHGTGSKSYTLEYWLSQADNLQELYLIACLYGFADAYTDMRYSNFDNICLHE